MVMDIHFEQGWIRGMIVGVRGVYRLSCLSSLFLYKVSFDRLFCNKLNFCVWLRRSVAIVLFRTMPSFLWNFSMTCSKIYWDDQRRPCTLFLKTHHHKELNAFHGSRKVALKYRFRFGNFL